MGAGVQLSDECLSERQTLQDQNCGGGFAFCVNILHKICTLKQLGVPYIAWN